MGKPITELEARLLAAYRALTVQERIPIDHRTQAILQAAEAAAKQASHPACQPRCPCLPPH